MTHIQQVCWELEMDYIGHPYYVTGNAIYHALGTTPNPERRQCIHASHGVFSPRQFGVFPDEHSSMGRSRRSEPHCPRWRGTTTSLYRNYGYGMTRLQASQLVDLDALDYGRLRDAESYGLELLILFVLRSGYPSTNDVDVPWWCGVDDTTRFRHREERIVEGAEMYRCDTIDHGQVVAYIGDRPVATAKNTILRVGSHSKYGFGELRVRPTPGENEAKQGYR